jgi:hypothetical protein
MEVTPAIMGLSCVCVRCVKHKIQYNSPVGRYNCNAVTWADACLYETIYWIAAGNFPLKSKVPGVDNAGVMGSGFLPLLVVFTNHI